MKKSRSIRIIGGEEIKGISKSNTSSAQGFNAFLRSHRVMTNKVPQNDKISGRKNRGRKKSQQRSVNT